jgi:hypothetical protein
MPLRVTDTTLRMTRTAGYVSNNPHFQLRGASEEKSALDDA